MAHTLAGALRTTPHPRTVAVRRALGADWHMGWLLVAPVVLIVTPLLIYPFLDAILLSFQERFIGKSGVWVGFANYAALFSEGSPWLRAAVTTLVVTAGAIGGKFLIGMAMACVLNQDLPAKNVFRGVMFLPWAVPAVVSAYVWRFMFDTTGPTTGAILNFGLLHDYTSFFHDA